MTWDRKKSQLEELMVNVLQNSNKPMRLPEIMAAIKEGNPQATTGKTPINSLYSVVYRNEKRRAQRGEDTYFIKEYIGGSCYYSLNNKK